MTAVLDPIVHSAVTDSDAPRRTYIGIWRDSGGIIRVLDESQTGSFSRVLRVRSNGHSHEFAWGYGGSGPAETAHAILADFMDADPHPALYQRFKFAVVASWDQNSGWTYPGSAVQKWLDECQVAASHRTVE